MIIVNYNPLLRTLCVEGHADSAPHGKDLVCAGVSALTYALEATCTTHPRYKGEIKRVERIGLFYCLMKSRKGEKAMECIADGLRLMAEAYPENIKFRERRELLNDNSQKGFTERD